MTQTDETQNKILNQLTRMADGLERANPAPLPNLDLNAQRVAIWDNEIKGLKAIEHFSPLPLDLLHGIDQQKQTLFNNSLQFAAGSFANHALLWGARGMGKSSLVKSIYGDLKHHLPAKAYKNLRLIEINNAELDGLPTLIDIINNHTELRFILFCDDLSFHKIDQDYKNLKTILEGGLAASPANLIFYATSNRRHLMSGSMDGNLQDTLINQRDTIDEETSLADRFGLWLGFHNCSQKEYLNMVATYATHFGAPTNKKRDLEKTALQWAAARGNRSGRVAWQFIRDWIGKQPSK